MQGNRISAPGLTVPCDLTMDDGMLKHVLASVYLRHGREVEAKSIPCLGGKSSRTLFKKTHGEQERTQVRKPAAACE